MIIRIDAAKYADPATTAARIQATWDAGQRSEAQAIADAAAVSVDQDWAAEETRHTFADGSAWITSGPTARAESREAV